MMNLIVNRHWVTGLSIIGQMSDDDTGEFIAFTLEPPYADPPTKPRAIPAGEYKLTVRYSPRFKRLMPHVEGVPDFDGVEIHIGNYPKDTIGCTLVGKAMGDDFVANSKQAFDALMGKLMSHATQPWDNTLVYQVGNITYVDPLDLVA